MLAGHSGGRSYISFDLSSINFGFKFDKMAVGDRTGSHTTERLDNGLSYFLTRRTQSIRS